MYGGHSKCALWKMECPHKDILVNSYSTEVSMNPTGLTKMFILTRTFFFFMVFLASAIQIAKGIHDLQNPNKVKAMEDWLSTFSM